MKKKILILTLIYILLFPFSSFAGENEISVFLDGKPFFTEYKTIIQDDRLMLSVKDVGRLISYDVSWIQEQNAAVLTDDERKIFFRLGRQEAVIEQAGKTTIKNMDTKPVITNGRLYIPVRFVSEMSKFQVSSDEEYRRINIISTDGEKTKEIPIKIKRAKSESHTNQTVVSPMTPVHYSPISKNLEEIADYIRNNIDPNFDIKKFDIKETISNYTVSDKTFSASISMNLIDENYILEDGYKVYINNGFVNTICINGNPILDSDFVNVVLSGGIDPEWLIGLAIENIDVSDDYDVVAATITEKNDGKLFFDVMIEYESFQGFGYIDNFEYRP